MFKINWTYEKEGRAYASDYNQEKGSIFIIKGKVGSGKTTLLEILALGFEVLKDKKTFLKPDLRDRIERLISPNACLGYKFVVKDPKDKIVIESKKDKKSKAIEHTINGKRVMSERMIENFKVIFDTPDKPVEKIRNMKTDLIETLAKNIGYVKDSREIVMTRLSEIEEFENYEKTKQKYEERIKTKKKEFKECETILKEKGRQYEEANQRYVNATYNYLENKLIDLDVQLKEANRQRKQVEQANIKNPDSRISKAMRGINDTLNLVRKITIDKKLYIKETIDSIKPKNKAQEYGDLFLEICTSCNQKTQELTNIKCIQFAKICQMIVDALSGNKLLHEELKEERPYKLIESLINLLKEYETVDITIPGFNKTINEILIKLEDERTLLGEKLKEKEQIEDVITHLTTLRDLLNKIASLAEEKAKYGLTDKFNHISYGADLADIEAQIKKIEDDLESTEKRFIKIEDEYDKLPKKMRHIVETKPLEYLETVKNTLYDGVQQYRQIKNEIENRIKIDETMIIEHKKKTTPKYLKHKEKLNVLSEQLYKILSKLQNSQRYLMELEVSAKTKYVQEPEAIKFYGLLSKYLAAITKIVYFEGKVFPLKEIDVINSKFILKGDKKLDLIELSTGQSQALSLLYQLKQPSDRKKIVLFDEIGNLDEETLNLVINELRSQIADGRVLLAIFSKADDVHSKPIVKMLA